MAKAEGLDSPNTNIYDDPISAALDGTLQPGAGGAKDRGENLLELPAQDVARRLLRDWDESYTLVKPLQAQWKINRARSAGYTGVRVIKVQDDNRAYIPAGATPNTGMNKARRLTRRMAATLFADPPRIQALPSSDDEDDKASAEVATRALEEVWSEGRLDYPLQAMEAFDTASDYGSAFHWIWTDQYGGGWRPKTVMAHPQAESADDPQGEAIGLPPAPDVERFVTADGLLTDEADDAEQEWLPALKVDLLTGESVRFVPSTARDIWDADGAMVGTALAWGKLVQMFPDLEQLDEDERAAVFQYKPKNWKELLPASRRNREDAQRLEERLVFVLTVYRRACYEYPRGFYGIALGKETLAHRGPWWDEQHNQPLDVPLSQYKQYHDHGNPYGSGLMQHLGPGNELRQAMQAYQLEHLDRLTRRKVFVPMQSNLRPEQLQGEMGMYLPVVPGGEPKFEDVPPFPQAVTETLLMVTRDMDDESGLQETAQGLAPSSVGSGKHADRIIQQVNVGMSDLRQNTERALVRAGRIMLQQMRAFFTVPQLVRYGGSDGAFKVEQWSSADLTGAEDVRLSRGSFTQLSPATKAMLAREHLQEQVLDLMEYRRIVADSTGGMIAMQDNPHRNRVRRQIVEWNAGPPEGWMPPQPQVVLNPQTGQPQQVPPGPDPVLTGIFDQLPVDDEPSVAQLRVYELGRAIASVSFRKYAAEWGQALLTEYERARRAAGIATVAEQQQAAQAQAQAQQQAQQQASAQQAQSEQQRLMADMQKTQMQIASDERKTAMQAEADRQNNMLDVLASTNPALDAGTPQSYTR